MSNEKSSTPKSKDNRTRNFATVIYPESAPYGWQAILAEQFVPAFISPLHDKDINPGGEPKKPHHHVVIMYDNKKTIQQARELFEKIGGVGCEIVQSVRGYARYLCHLDNPEKAQYSPDDVRSLCGSDYTGVCSLVIDKYKAIRDMIQYCCENDIHSYATLLEYCASERFEWFRVLCDNGTVVMKEYLKSRTWTIRTAPLQPQDDNVAVDKNTGEVIETPSESPEKAPQSDEKPTWCGATYDEWKELYESATGESEEHNQNS